MNAAEWDLIILGGGCAGLSLARELARLEGRGKSIPSTLVLESKKTCQSSATWCRWRKRDRPAPSIEAHNWPTWTFSCEGQSVSHTSKDYTYGCIRSADFFHDALERIAGSKKIEVLTGAPAEVSANHHQKLRVTSNDQSFFCRQIVDTRPPSRDHISASRLFQVFSGVELEVKNRNMPSHAAGLMKGMTTDHLGFRFDYVLPFPGNRLLVESTRFSPIPLSEDQLDDDLNSCLRRVLESSDFTVHRRESGIIPMGMPALPQPDHPNWFLAGTRGGAVRPASGFAFADIQDWARQCACKLATQGTPVGHPAPAPVLRWMDDLFLSVLVRDPDRAPDLFMAMARNLEPDQFVRFMTGCNTTGDLLAVVKSLPKIPFLRELAAGWLPVKSSTTQTLAS